MLGMRAHLSVQDYQLYDTLSVEADALAVECSRGITHGRQTLRFSREDTIYTQRLETQSNARSISRSRLGSNR
jgi:hypothetical protein